MTNIITLLLILLAGLITQAETLTNNGKVYVDVALLTNRCNAAGIAFTHKAGIAKLDFMELSDSNKKKYGFDPVLYQEFKDEEARLQTAPPPPPTTAPAVTNPSVTFPPDTPVLAPAKDFKPIKRVVVITNTPPRITPFVSSPETTIRPDNDKMNEARLKIMKKARQVNSHAQ